MWLRANGTVSGREEDWLAGLEQKRMLTSEHVRLPGFGCIEMPGRQFGAQRALTEATRAGGILDAAKLHHVLSARSADERAQLGMVKRDGWQCSRHGAGWQLRCSGRSEKWRWTTDCVMGALQ